ncbi:MAG: hypothetical protein ABIG44_19350 [Planctomycetota bacterium]
MNESRRCISLAKGRHRFVFYYVEERASDLLAALVSLANDPDSVFDWFDAAVLSFEIGRQARLELGAVA